VGDCSPNPLRIDAPEYRVSPALLRVLWMRCVMLYILPELVVDIVDMQSDSVILSAHSNADDRDNILLSLIRIVHVTVYGTVGG